MPTKPSVERLNEGKPILEKIPDHPWESDAVFNPACAIVDDRAELDTIIASLPFDKETKTVLASQSALVFMVYRARGKKEHEFDYRRPSLGLAILSASLEPLVRHDRPVLEPDQPYDEMGVGEGRITRIGDWYIMTYTASAKGTPDIKIRIGLASTRDFIHWEKHGLLQGDFAGIHNRNASLFPDKAYGNYVMLHRPMEGIDAMAIHYGMGTDLFGTWRTRGVLLPPIPIRGTIDTWVGGGAPPLALPGGRHLMLYHVGSRRADGSREHDLGMAVVDFSSPDIIVQRCEPILQPETEAETQQQGDQLQNRSVFTCGAYFHEGGLYFPYSGAESVILGGKIGGKDLEQFLQ